MVGNVVFVESSQKMYIVKKLGRFSKAFYTM